MVAGAGGQSGVSRNIQPKETVMQTPISWFEIPASNFERARHFYEQTFGVELHFEEKPEFKMGIFPHSDQGSRWLHYGRQGVSACGYRHHRLPLRR